MKAVTTEQMRVLDARTIAAGTPAEELMERAGFAVARRVGELLRQRGGQAVLLLAGNGNNGGDAVVAARHLEAAGCRVRLARAEEASAALVTEFAPDVIVDGLLGTGLSGEVREPFATAIRLINESEAPVVAIDVPSGLGTALCVRATVTVTMGLPKIALLEPAAVEFVGRIEVADIGLKFVEEVRTDVELITAGDVVLPGRRRDAHKGECGHLLVIAGSEGYTGAPVLCAHAAARSGAGLVTVAVPRGIYPVVAAQCPPEVMVRALDRLEALNDFDAVALGPGLGREEETQRQVVRWVSERRRPMVVDADGLNALARNLTVLNRLNAPLVLTPHPGEMGRLIGQTAGAVQARRWEVAREFARKHGVTVVLKGAGTVVTEATGPLWVNATGNPGMAKGGMGDALTGIIGALLAQGMKPVEAARAGVFVHGLAGDRAAERRGVRAMLASDLIGELGGVFAVLD